MVLSNVLGRGTAHFFFFNDTATTEIYTLSLHDALPISVNSLSSSGQLRPPTHQTSLHKCPIGNPFDIKGPKTPPSGQDRKSTRLNSSHANISYAVFCLKKKKISRTQ